jgi:hypothetical protein
MEQLQGVALATVASRLEESDVLSEKNRLRSMFCPSTSNNQDQKQQGLCFLLGCQRLQELVGSVCIIRTAGSDYEAFLVSSTTEVGKARCQALQTTISV